MKYISIDTETTGLDPENCQILSFGAIIEDTNNPLPFEKVPKFYKVMKLRHIQGQPYALNLNKGLIEEIKEGKSENLISPDNFTDEFMGFLEDNGLFSYEIGAKNEKIKVAGKNFSGFDKLFIEKLPRAHTIEFHQRVLDPAALYVDFKNDEWLPNLDTCLERAGVERTVTHNALEDAWDVILTLRNKYQ